jgi:hypothetical protein
MTRMNLTIGLTDVSRVGLLSGAVVDPWWSAASLHDQDDLGRSRPSCDIAAGRESVGDTMAVAW